MKTVPGPPALPVFGNLIDIGMDKAVPALGRPPPHVAMHELSRQYGEVMSLRFGSERWTVLSSPAAVHDAFVTKGSDFSGRPMVRSMSFSAGGGRGFAQPQLTPELRALRRTAFAELFGPAQVARAAAALDEETAQLAEHLLRCGTAPLRPALRHSVCNMVLRYAFSSRVPFEFEERRDAIAVAGSATGGASRAAGPSDSATISRKEPPELIDEGQQEINELVEVVDSIWTTLTSTQTTFADLVLPDAVPDALAYGPLAVSVARCATSTRRSNL